ncbi:hypothetical protein MLD38_017187 [Melastoma candidum]|uniref:Uncharacterized protein n=1 Tax=Melastoma candidum TaxID=119954 RepID=A0ACB9QP83_9MYRT|nr:hypothetical protein MLD38_017187 [Melastoma candidum]
MEGGGKVKEFKKRKHGKEGSDVPGKKKARVATLKGKPQGGNDSKTGKFEAQKKKKSSEIKKGEAPQTKKERRLHAKELTEARKQKRKRHYNLERELVHLWEKMRQHNVAKEERAKLTSEALGKMKGKIHEIASSHVSSRVLQACIKSCSQDERDSVFEEVKPHLILLACNTYAVHLVKKLMDTASKKQVASVISLLRGHVAALLRHMVGSVVIEHAYQLANASQKQELLMELYSTELQLFKDFVASKESRLVDVITKLGLQKGSVARHMGSVIQPILEKGIVDHSIIHKILVEYLSIADKSSASDVLQQLSGPLLVRMIHTRDGSQLGILCIKHGTAKERKKIIKGMKGHIVKIAHDQYGSLFLGSVISVTDDTKLVTKIIVQELQTVLKDLIRDKNGRRPLLQLLHPNCPRYLSPSDLALLNSSLPSLCVKDESENASLGNEPSNDKTMVDAKTAPEDIGEGEDLSTVTHSIDGRKDPVLRRRELLINSGLAESLVDVCIECAEELISSNFGKEVIYEVAIGAADGILRPALDDKLSSLHEAIARLAATSKSEDSDKEHVLENFHSSRTIRKLVLDCPSFATTLWNKALRLNCRAWAEGHSGKVVHAFLESSNLDVCNLVKMELQALIDEGVLKVPEKKPSKNTEG